MNIILEENFKYCLTQYLNIRYENFIFFKTRGGFQQCLINPLGFYITSLQRENLKTILESTNKSYCLSSTIIENPLNNFSLEEEKLIANFGYSFKETFTHILPLKETFELTIKQAKKKRRWELRKYKNTSWDKFFAIKISNSDFNILNDFYNLYLKQFKKQKKTLWLYKKELLKCLMLNKFIRVFVIYHNNIPIGASIFLEDNNQVLYWLSTINKEYSKDLVKKTGLYPSSLLWGAIIEFYIGKGVKFINLGASENLPNVEKFKILLGGQKYYYKIWYKHSVGIKIFKRILKLINYFI